MSSIVAYLQGHETMVLAMIGAVVEVVFRLFPSDNVKSLLRIAADILDHIVPDHSAPSSTPPSPPAS